MQKNDLCFIHCFSIFQMFQLIFERLLIQERKQNLKFLRLLSKINYSIWIFDYFRILCGQKVQSQYVKMMC